MSAYFLKRTRCGNHQHAVPAQCTLDAVEHFLLVRDMLDQFEAHGKIDGIHDVDLAGIQCPVGDSGMKIILAGMFDRVVGEIDTEAPIWPLRALAIGDP